MWSPVTSYSTILNDLLLSFIFLSAVTQPCHVACMPPFADAAQNPDWPTTQRNWRFPLTALRLVAVIVVALTATTPAGWLFTTQMCFSSLTENKIRLE